MKISVRIIAIHFLIAIIFLTLLDIFTWNYTKSFLISEIQEDLSKKISLAKVLIGEISFDEQDRVPLHEFAIDIKELTSLRTTLINRSGEVVADSEIDPNDLQEVENHLNRPEVQKALREGAGLAERRSTTIGVKLFYYCETVKKNGRIVGLIRLAMFAPEFEAKMDFLKNLIIIINVVIVFMVAISSFSSGHWIKSLLNKLSDELYRQRDFPKFKKLESVGYEELDQVVNEINTFGLKSDEKVEKIDTYNKQFFTIFNSLSEGVAAFNNNGIAILHNVKFREILGVSPGNDTTIRFYDWIHFPPLLKDIEEFLKSNKPIQKRTKFYDNRYIDYQILPLIKDDVPLSGFLLTLTDVTHLQQLETIRQDFVANVTHEFKTPLTSIRGYAETLLGGNVDNKKMRQNFLKKIERQTIHLENLVTDLLQLSRIEKRKSIELTKLNPVPLVKKIILEFVPAFKEKKITFYQEIEKADKKIKIIANKNLLHTIVANLLSNAIQYTPGEGNVWFRFKINKTDVRIEVEDSGPGIPADELDRIFERFYRLNEARSVYAEGSGLGLSIVKHSVEIIGGELGVESELNKGSLFWVEIPIK